MSQAPEREHALGRGQEVIDERGFEHRGSRSWRTWRWVPVGIGAAAVGLLAVRDPSRSGSYGFCPLHAVTGLDCPFCGGLRGTYALLHGDVATALDHNLLLPLYLGVLVAVGVKAFRGPRPDRFGDLGTGRGRLWVWGLVAVTLVFFVVRNLPWFPYLDARA
jgi:hypothetical protein